MNNLILSHFSAKIRPDTMRRYYESNLFDIPLNVKTTIQLIRFIRAINKIS